MSRNWRILGKTVPPSTHELPLQIYRGQHRLMAKNPPVQARVRIELTWFWYLLSWANHPTFQNLCLLFVKCPSEKLWDFIRQCMWGTWHRGSSQETLCPKRAIGFVCLFCSLSHVPGPRSILEKPIDTINVCSMKKLVNKQWQIVPAVLNEQDAYDVYMR